LNVPLATWLLAVVTFVAGTLTPFIYRRFFHGGISILPLNMKAATKLDAENVVYVGRFLHMANASARSILIDNVKVPDFKVGDVRWKAGSVIFADATKSKMVHIPLWDSDTTTILPLILKSDESRIFILQYELTPPDGKYVAKEKLARFDWDNFWVDTRIRLRINGIFRRYRISDSEAQPLHGYKIHVDARRGENT
jgi:hypothetical protein